MSVGRRDALAFLAPCGAVFHDPVEQCFLEADVVAGFFALDPFMALGFDCAAILNAQPDAGPDGIRNMGTTWTHRVLRQIKLVE